MDPLDFLSVAGKLICSPDEAERRTAISRAYYAVYHYIKTDLVGADAYLDHTVLVNCLTETKVEKFELLGESVKNLRTDRIFADYKIHRQLNQKTCDTMIDRCREAIKDFESCKESGLIDAARDYLRRFGYMR
jgi:uncharacterized protein (UPF0332 family)